MRRVSVIDARVRPEREVAVGSVARRHTHGSQANRHLHRLVADGGFRLFLRLALRVRRPDRRT